MVTAWQMVHSGRVSLCAGATLCLFLRPERVIWCHFCKRWCFVITDGCGMGRVHCRPVLARSLFALISEKSRTAPSQLLHNARPALHATSIRDSDGVRGRRRGAGAGG